MKCTNTKQTFEDNEKRLQTPLSVHSWVRFFFGMWRFYASGPGAVHIFAKNMVFIQYMKRSPFDHFPFSHLEMCAVLERGALGSLGWAKNGTQEVFF